MNSMLRQTAVLASLAIAVTGCSEPLVFRLYNNTSSTIVTLADDNVADVTIQPGQTGTVLYSGVSRATGEVQVYEAGNRMEPDGTPYYVANDGSHATEPGDARFCIGAHLFRYAVPFPNYEYARARRHEAQLRLQVNEDGTIWRLARDDEFPLTDPGSQADPFPLDGEPAGACPTS